MKRSLKPFTTTLVGGVFFLLPLVIVVVVFGEGLALMVRALQPLVAMMPLRWIGSVALATILAAIVLVLVCFAAGLVARAAAGRAFKERFEHRLQTLYPRYAVIKAMSQGLYGALGAGPVGQYALKPVLVRLDDHRMIAFETERLSDGQAVLYVPGAPDIWSGSVVLVPGERVQRLDVAPADIAKALRALGIGTKTLLDPDAPPQTLPRSIASAD
jgi:uncharacterized membrane protein